MNYIAVERGGNVIEVEVPKVGEYRGEGRSSGQRARVHQKVVRPMSAQRGYDLPVSAFKGREDGTWK